MVSKLFQILKGDNDFIINRRSSNAAIKKRHKDKFYDDSLKNN